MKLRESTGVADESQVTVRQYLRAAAHHAYPVAWIPPDPATRFRALVREWKRESAPHSSVTKMVLIPSYQRIIALGPVAIPLILRELEREADHWFWALSALTGVDPTLKENRGSLDKMSEDWLRWGRDQGLIRER